MARKYEYGVGAKVFQGWGMERCEEQVFIAYWHEVRHRVPTEVWVRQMEDHFYIHGTGLSVVYVDKVNQVRRRCGLDEIEIHETDIYEYGRNSDRVWKAQQRREMRDHYLAADPDARHKWITRAMHEMRSLPPPHQTLEEFKQRRAVLPEGLLSDRERTLRARAVMRYASAPVAEAEDPAPPDIPAPPVKPAPVKSVERVIRQLKLAQGLEDDDLVQQIIQQVDADDALTLAEQLDDGKLRRALLLQSMKT